MEFSRLCVAGSLPMGVPAERAWAVFADVDRWRSWDWIGSASARWLDGEPWAVGSRLRAGHRPFTFDCVVTHGEPGRRVAWTGRWLWFHGRHAFEFEPLGADDSRVRTVEVFTGWGAGLLRPLIRAFWRYQLGALRRACAPSHPVADA